MILQEAKPNSITLQNMSVTAIAVYLCHSVGFRRVGYTIQDIDPQDTHAKLKYYWVDPERSVWEALQDISEATQTAFYFDENDVLQIKTRAAAFDLAQNPVWVFDGEDIDAAAVTAQNRPAGDLGKVADLVSFVENEQQRPNNIDVKYMPTEASKVIRGNPTMGIAWEPEETITLRASNLITDIPLNSSTEHAVKLSSADANIWPYSGMFQVNSEVIRYEGKQYSYYLANGTVATKYIESAEEKAALDALNEGFAWRNVFTGNLRVKVGGRGYKNTVVAAHARAGKTYSCRIRTAGGPLLGGAKYVTKDLTNGIMRLNLVSYKPASFTRLVAKVQSPLANAPRLYGTTIKFPTSGYSAGVAGLFIGGGLNDSGVYIEIGRTAINSVRTRNHELNVTFKNSSGVQTLYGKGAQVAIAAGVEYQMDVAITSDGTNHYFTTYIDGAPRLVTTIPKATLGVNISNWFGVFVRANTIADFGYLYGYGGHPDDGGFDGATYLDLIKGGYRSAVYRQVVSTLPSSTGFGMKPVSTSWRTNALNATYVDEFGAVAHEVRDFDVSYTEKPALHSMLYLSNSAQAACSAFVSSPVGAKFTLVNPTRKTAVINGEDTLSFGKDNSVEQKLMVYGRLITREEPKTKNVRNETSIVRQGVSEMTVESDWIQTEEQASRIASWLIGNSTTGEGDLKAFANPYIQLLDMVAVQDPDNFREWQSSKYFVMSRNIEYSGGLTVDFTLRRAV